MISCIFRLMEIESGVVEVDGVNIARIPLKTLRSKMAIIPQVRSQSVWCTTIKH